MSVIVPLPFSTNVFFGVNERDKEGEKRKPNKSTFDVVPTKQPAPKAAGYFENQDEEIKGN